MSTFQFKLGLELCQAQLSFQLAMHYVYKLSLDLSCCCAELINAICCCLASKAILTLINATYFQKPAVSVLFLHSKQHKTFQGTLGTQDLTSIGSKTSLGPSMDPTGPLSWTLWFLRKFWAVYTNSTFSIL